jgi:amino acid transporter
MAEAFVEERHLLKALRWWDGFVIALCNPGFLIASLGFSMGALGTWGAVLLWGISASVGMLQTWIYSESASMFPDKSGGISLYAHEGWRGGSRWPGRSARSVTGSAGRWFCRSSAGSSAT